MCGAKKDSFECDKKKASGNCNYSCHKKGCRCGKCPDDFCNNPTHFKGCHCGSGMNTDAGSWHGIAE